MDTSNIHVNNDGRILKDISAKMEIPCPTCSGRGKITDPKTIGRVIGYCGINGETAPQVSCRTCGGEGWVLTNQPSK